MIETKTPISSLLNINSAAATSSVMLDSGPFRATMSRPENPRQELHLEQKRIADFKNAMKPAQGQGGIIGNIGSNGLRSDDWQRLVSNQTQEEILARFAKGSEALKNCSLFGEGVRINLTNAASRNVFVHKIMDLHERGTFHSLSKEDQIAVLDATKALEGAARLITADKMRIKVGMSIDVGTMRSLPSGYVSPMAGRIVETNMDKKYWYKQKGNGRCQEKVTELLYAALDTSKRFTAGNPILAANRKVYEKHYDYVLVEGATFQDVKDAPIGAVALYDDPRTSAKNKAHAQVKIDNSTKGWVSDFRHDAYVYGDTPPRGLKFYLYIPKDYLNAFGRIA